MKVRKLLLINSVFTKLPYNLKFNKILKKGMFEILSPEEYMFNSKRSKSERTIKKEKLNPIIPSKC